MAFPGGEHASSAKRGTRSPKVGILSSGDAGPSRKHRLYMASAVLALLLLLSFGYLTIQGGSSGASSGRDSDAASLGTSAQALNVPLVEQRNLVADPVTGTAALGGQSREGDREQGSGRTDGNADESSERASSEGDREGGSEKSSGDESRDRTTEGKTEGQAVEQARAEGPGDEGDKEGKQEKQEKDEREEEKEEAKEKEEEEKEKDKVEEKEEEVKGEAGSEGEKGETREEADEKEEGKREEEAEEKEDGDDKGSKKEEEEESKGSESEGSKDRPAEGEQQQEDKEKEDEEKDGKGEREGKGEEKAEEKEWEKAEEKGEEKEDKKEGAKQEAKKEASGSKEQEAAESSEQEEPSKGPDSGEKEQGAASAEQAQSQEKKTKTDSKAAAATAALPAFRVPPNWSGVKEAVPLAKKEMYMRLIQELLPEMQSVRDLAAEKGNKQLRTHAEGALGRGGELAAAWDALGAEKGWGGEERVMGIIKVMEQIRARGQEWRSSVQQLERVQEQVESLKTKMHEVSRERNGLDLAVAKGLPKALFCFNLKLSQAFFSDPQLQEGLRQREEEERPKFSDPDLHHYALFSDNVLAAAVVVNSTVQNLAEPSRHVLHLVTDSLNLPGMKAWFAMHPPVKRGGGQGAEGTDKSGSESGVGQRLAVEIRTVESFPFLNASYCPVLKQLQAASMRSYYFSAKEGARKRKRTQEAAAATAGASAGGIGGGKGARELIVTGKGEEGVGGEGNLERSQAPGGSGPKGGASDVGGSSQLKFKNPKYLSMLNHLRFYLPEMYPTLHRVVFLDDDIVVQKDLTPLFSIPLEGNVNAAVFTCANNSTFHRLQHYLNFGNPYIKARFDPDACGWAYGMNVFDLDAWREKGLTAVYHDYQTRNEGRTLWKLGTLPPGLMTFYKLTYALDPSWHVLGLGYNREIPVEEAQAAAVVHYNGNWKPWLDTALSHFKGFWTKYAPVEDELVQQCNIDVN